ncbi:Rha family transcriptional regulator (plasmid) [Deinococcus sp. KNUC1210]|uniref:Rha family transcriptional regulator n=1 Tax=Deinococcus sp. KNUC1210 TaxID=2917691 RepID=UPI001EF07744|nr:Rha family transcriptional regulator [Deinococcus sp. KNUC1210]ULH17397.1 Rha family transcriptional regulator [Deinococcus sp. KNUC1210]
MSPEIKLQFQENQAFADSRELAAALGNQHKNVVTLIGDYHDEFKSLGILAFETEVINGRGQPAKYALLNEDQCYFLLTLVRNSEMVVKLKLRLVQLFKLAREQLQQVSPIQTLPTDPLELLALSLQSLQQQRGQIQALQTGMHAVEQRLDNTPIRMDSVMASRISQLCKELGAVHPKQWPGAYRAFKEAMGQDGVPLARYDSLPMRRFAEAERWLTLQIQSFAAERPLLEHWDRQ